MELILYYHRRTRAQRVRWMLEELGVDYSLVDIDIYKGEGRKPEYQAIHPLGQLPAIRIDGKVMIESGAIIHWLAEAHPQSGLAPSLDSPERTEFLQWMYFAVTTLEQPATEITLHGKILPDSIAVKEIIPFDQHRLARALQALEPVFNDREYLLKSGFSAADILAGSMIMWMNEEIADFPNLQEYGKRLKQRPAYRKLITGGAK